MAPSGSRLVHLPTLLGSRATRLGRNCFANFPAWNPAATGRAELPAAAKRLILNLPQLTPLPLPPTPAALKVCYCFPASFTSAPKRDAHAGVAGSVVHKHTHQQKPAH